MKIDPKDYLARPGEKLSLKDWPTNREPLYKSKDHYAKLLADHVQALSARQRLFYAADRYALLLIFQGMDAAGKDSAIAHVMSGVNPQGCQVFSFKQPSPEELKHDFLWRTDCRLPERGRFGIFNRSYYEEVLVVRVHPELLRSEQLYEKARAGKNSGRGATAPSSTSRAICTATACALSSSFCTFPGKNNASGFSSALTTRRRIGNSAWPIFASGITGRITCRRTKIASAPPALIRRRGT